jgi:hypothetical protein
LLDACGPIVDAMTPILIGAPVGPAARELSGPADAVFVLELAQAATTQPNQADHAHPQQGLAGLLRVHGVWLLS